jgi:hypothetical protein
MDSEGIVKESIGGERAIGAIITLLLWLETELKKKDDKLHRNILQNTPNGI